MYPNNPGADSVRTALQFRYKKENSLSCVHVLRKTMNLVISRCCFVEDGKEMYKNLYRTCRVIVLLIKPFVLWRSRQPSLSCLLKFPIRTIRTYTHGYRGHTCSHDSQLFTLNLLIECFNVGADSAGPLSVSKSCQKDSLNMSGFAGHREALK